MKPSSCSSEVDWMKRALCTRSEQEEEENQRQRELQVQATPRAQANKETPLQFRLVGVRGPHGAERLEPVVHVDHAAHVQVQPITAGGAKRVRRRRENKRRERRDRKHERMACSSGSNQGTNKKETNRAARCPAHMMLRSSCVAVTVRSCAAASASASAQHSHAPK